MKQLAKVALWVVCMTIPTAQAWAVWPADPSSNVPVDTLGSQDPEIVSDGTGGYFVAWVTGRYGPSMVLVQHFDSTAQPLWSANGLLVAPSGAPGQTRPQVLRDGNGGVFVAWVGFSPGTSEDVYAQRIGSGGDRLWGASGAAVRVAAGDQGYPVLSPDGSDGVLVAWTGPGLCVQRLNGAGVAQWAASGVSLAVGSSSIPKLVPDGSGGAITAWSASGDIIAQRVDAAGAPLWGANGVAVCSASGQQSEPVMVSDGSGGVIVAWTDRRGGLNWADFDDVYAQRVNAAGVAQWTPDGVGVCTSASWQGDVSIVEDGMGGAVLAWSDHRDDSTHVFVQRLDDAGAGQWGANGIGLFTTDAAQIMPVLATDGAGGAFVAWMDHRSGEFQTYGQRVTRLGEQLWGAGGLALSTATGRQEHQRIAWDGGSDAAVVWGDYRGSNDSVLTVSVYAQGVQASGLGNPPVAGAQPVGPGSTTLSLASANPSRGEGISVRFTLRGGESASIDVMDITGRRMLTRTLDSFGHGSHTVGLLSGAGVAPGLYLVRLREGNAVCTTRVVRVN